jgi:hypothetical protein
MLISVCPLGFSRILYFRLFTTVVLDRCPVPAEECAWMEE